MEPPVAEIPLETRFAVLSQITRAQHFAWREAVRRMFPGADPAEAVNLMWEITGEQTAEAYAKRVNLAKPLAPQVADCIAWSSRCMGEDASVLEKDGQTFVRHSDCPWFHWHKRQGLLAEDRPGCDRWFAATFAELGRRIGAQIGFETLETLPEGGSCCLRRITAQRAGEAPRA